MIFASGVDQFRGSAAGGVNACVRPFEVALPPSRLCSPELPVAYWLVEVEVELDHLRGPREGGGNGCRSRVGVWRGAAERGACGGDLAGAREVS